MDNILALFDNLRLIEKNLDMFFGQTVFQPALDRMMMSRRKVLQQIVQVQIRTFSRD